MEGEGESVREGFYAAGLLRVLQRPHFHVSEELESKLKLRGSYQEASEVGSRSYSTCEEGTM